MNGCVDGAQCFCRSGFGVLIRRCSGFRSAGLRDLLVGALWIGANVRVIATVLRRIGRRCLRCRLCCGCGCPFIIINRSAVIGGAGIGAAGTVAATIRCQSPSYAAAQGWNAAQTRTVLPDAVKSIVKAAVNDPHRPLVERLKTTENRRHFLGGNR